VPAIAKPIELVHWSWLVASDGDVWKKMIDAFNAANKDIQIRMEIIPDTDINQKVLASVAAGQAPDFGWNTGGLQAQWANDGVIVPLEDLAKKVGLDLTDFSDAALKTSRVPRMSNGLYLIPMDAMCEAMEINTDHAKAAGLDITKPPANGDDLITWAKAMTQIKGGKVDRSGIMMTGSGVQPCVTWGMVAEQMGFQRASDDLKTACINPEKGKEAMQWVLDLFDTHQVSTRDVTDRYKAFGNGQGSIFWTGPWTINGYVTSNLPFISAPMANIGGKLITYYELGGLEVYAQKDPGRQEATMKAIKWLSDNSFLWTTVGRGASPRKSITSAPNYKTAGADWKVRGAFVDSMSFATIAPVPVLAADDFQIYSGGNFLATEVAAVVAGKKTIDQFMTDLQTKWQKDLDAG
jgi:multiple sugar transport system substrate-binding protein